MYRLRNMRCNLSNRRYSVESEKQKSRDKIPGRLPDLPPMQNVLSGGCNHYFAREVNTGSCFLGIIFTTVQILIRHRHEFNLKIN